MNIRIPLTVALVVISATGLLALDSCQPNCFGHEAEDRVEDPMNCTQFYICVYEGQPSDNAVSCGLGNYFDVKSGECVPGTCEPSCVPVECDQTCKDASDIIQDPLDCNAYYLCSPDYNTEGPFYCPQDRPYFDGDHCISDSSKCCTNMCLPYCHPGDVQIIDPKDCTKYYICSIEGPAMQANLFHCPSGEVFQMSSATCKAGATCVTLCP